MCGEFDDEDYIDDHLFSRLLGMAGKHGVVPGEPDERAPPDLSEQAARSDYMTSLFKAGLTRALNDANNLNPGDRMDAVAGQAMAFARLAGFLAGQLPPGADILRPSIEAFMDGHREPAEWGRQHDHHHSHEH